MATTGQQVVKLHIYDLSKGMARGMSQMFLGRQIDGIWHTGVVVYGAEYYFGGEGIQSCPPCGTILGQPDRVKDMGPTQIPYGMLLDYLTELATSTFRPEKYHLMDHNCNTFSSELSQFLTGNDIPAEITGLPGEVMSTPFGQMLRPMLDAMSVQPSGGQSFNPPQQNTMTQNQSNSSTQNMSATHNRNNNEANANTQNPSSNVKSTVSSANEKSTASSATVKSTASSATVKSSSANSKTATTDKSSLLSELPVLRKWAWYEDDKTPKAYAVTVNQMLTEAATQPSQLQTSTDIQDVINIVEAKGDVERLSFQHLTNLAQEITNPDQIESTRHFCLLLFSCCLLQQNVPLTTGPTSPLHTIVRSYHTLPHSCKSALCKLLANAIRSAEDYTNITQESDLLFSVITDALSLDGQDVEYYTWVTSVVFNLSLHCKSEEQYIDLSSAILERLKSTQSQNIAETLLVSLLRFMDRSELVTAVAMTTDIDWPSLGALSPKLTHLVDILKSVI